MTSTDPSDAGAVERKRFDFMTIGVLAFAAIALFVKQTLPISLVGVPVASRLPIVVAGLVMLELAPAVAAARHSMVLRILAVDAVVSLIVEADLVSFRINRRFLSILTLPLVPYLSHIGDAITSAIHGSDGLLLLDIPLLIAFAAVLRRGDTQGKGPSKALAGVGLAVLAIAMGTDPYWRDATLRNPATAGHASLVPFHLINTGSSGWTALRARYFGPRHLQSLQQWYAERRPRTNGPLLPQANTARFENVILLQFESLQAWTVGMRVGGVEVTPTLNRLRDRALSFEDAYSQVGAGNTADAEWLALCSWYPATGGVAFLRYASEDLRCLPELLHDRGVETIAFHGNDLGVYDRDEMYPAVGFSQRYGRRTLRATSDRYEIPDGNLYPQILPRIPRGGPFAVHIVSFSSHRPFRVPPQNLPLGKLSGTVAGAYLESIHYADVALGQLMKALEAEHLLEGTLLVIYGDHAGINREDHSTAALPLTLPANEAEWFAFERRVPLLFIGEGLPPARVKIPAGQIDIAPTIAALMGVRTEHAGFLGRDLLRTEAGPLVFWAGHVLDAKHVYLEGRGAGGPLCFAKEGEEVPVAECGTLAAYGRREREQAQIVLDADLITSLGR